MTQPTFTDGPLVPLMVNGIIDAATVRQLFNDLATFATVLGVREKSGSALYTRDREVSLSDAVIRVLAGTVQATQVRYNFSDYEWTDTIMATPDGFRVVRCRHEMT